MKSLREHQLMAAKALEYLADLCRKNGIPYYLLAGSCLGGIRHKGFIPWDDDIDVGIFNTDYERFENLILKSIPEGFQWISNKTSDSYSRFFGSILDIEGVALIDVFVLIPLPNSEKHIKSMWRMRHLISKLYARKFRRTFEDEALPIYYLSKIISFFLSRKFIVRMARWNENRYRNKASGDYINLYSIYTLEREIIKREWLFPQSKVEFEGKMYTTVSEVDSYLCNLYGDYMKIPDEAERQLRHIDVVYGNNKEMNGINISR